MGAFGKSFESSFEKSHAEASRTAGELAALKLKSKLEEDRELRAEKRAFESRAERNISHAKNILGMTDEELVGLETVAGDSETPEDFAKRLYQKRGIEALKKAPPERLTGYPRLHQVLAEEQGLAVPAVPKDKMMPESEKMKWQIMAEEGVGPLEAERKYKEFEDADQVRALNHIKFKQQELGEVVDSAMLENIMKSVNQYGSGVMKTGIWGGLMNLLPFIEAKHPVLASDVAFGKRLATILERTEGGLDAKSLKQLFAGTEITDQRLKVISKQTGLSSKAIMKMLGIKDKDVRKVPEQDVTFINMPIGQSSE